MKGEVRDIFSMSELLANTAFSPPPPPPVIPALSAIALIQCVKHFASLFYS